MKRKEALKVAAEKLPKKRFKHCQRVAETAEEMAEMFNADSSKAYLAGVLHDYSKYDDLAKMYQTVSSEGLDPEQLEYKSEVLNGPIAAVKVKNKNGESDIDVLKAISNHTSDSKQIEILEMIIFVADYIEAERRKHGVDDIRTIVYEEKIQDKRVYAITKRNNQHLLNKYKTIYHKTLECLKY